VHEEHGRDADRSQAIEARYVAMLASNHCGPIRRGAPNPLDSIIPTMRPSTKGAQSAGPFSVGYSVTACRVNEEEGLSRLNETISHPNVRNLRSIFSGFVTLARRAPHPLL
jgi:hypothetical protein